MSRYLSIYRISLCLLSLLVGFLYVGPLLTIRYQLSQRGRPFVFSYENYRNDLTYLARAREVYDGHSPYHDPFSDDSRPTVRNPISPVLLAGLIYLAGGDVFWGYLAANFIFSQVIFALFYLLGLRLFSSRRWSVLFALVGILTPISLRLFNFHGTA